MRRRFRPRPLFRKAKLPKGFRLPKPGQTKPSRPSKDPRQLSLFEPPKRLPGDYVAQPLAADLALQLLAEQGDRFSPDERAVLQRIGHKPQAQLTPAERESLNRVFAKLKAPA